MSQVSSRRTLQTKKYQDYYKPLIIIVSYWLFTLSVFMFGPLHWKGSESWDVTIYLLVCWIMFSVGFLFSKGIFNQKAVYNKINYHFLIKWGAIGNLSTVFLAIYAYTGKLPYEIGLSISSQGDVYREYQEYLSFTSGSSVRLISGSIRSSIQPLGYASIILGVKYWKELRLPIRYLVVGSFISLVLLSFARGTDKELADLIVFFVAASSVSITNRSKQQAKSIIWVYAILAVIFVGLFTERRLSRYDYQISECVGYQQVCVNRETNPIKSLLGHNRYMSLALSSGYISQGYNGLAESFNYDFKFCYGIGHSAIAMRLVNRLTGVEIYPDTFNYRMRASGWDDRYNWSSMYTALANNVSHYGVPIILMFLGLLFGISWKRAKWFGDDAAVMVFAFLSLQLVYAPANFQLGVSLDVYFSWIVWLFYFIYKILLVGKNR